MSESRLATTRGPNPFDSTSGGGTCNSCAGSFARQSAVLDLGCGPGGSTTRALAGNSHLVGVDISWTNVVLARQAIPTALFVQGDMTQVQFRPRSFDGIAAFYSLMHVPRDEQPVVLDRAAEWLREDGLLVLSLGVGNHEYDFDDDFLGSPMYWSSYDEAGNRAMVERADFEVVLVRTEVAEEYGEPIAFQWIDARNLPSGPNHE